MTSRQRIWIDTETLLPLKRQLELDEKSDEKAVETHSDWKLDAEIEDKTFELPRDK